MEQYSDSIEGNASRRKIENWEYHYMNERLNRFTSLLKQIFELDKSDLDFGIYRVMNLRKAQIEEFLTERLPMAPGS